MTLDLDGEVRPTLVGDAARRHVKLLVLLALVGATLGYLFAANRPVSYSSTATILVNPLEGNPFTPSGRGEQLINLETEAQLVRTDAVAELAKAEVGASVDTLALLDGVSVSVPVNTQVLDIAYQSNDAEEARARAQAFAESYLAHRAARAQKLVDDRLARVDEQRAAAEQDLQNATAELAATPPTASQRAFLTERVNALVTQVAELDQQVNQLTATPIDPGQVITPAARQAGDASRTTGLYVLVGAIAGALLGFGVALARERSNHRVRDRQDVEQIGAPVLAQVDSRPTSMLVSAEGADVSEDYRRLRTAVLAQAPHPPGVLVVTATGRNHAAQSPLLLASALVRSGTRVVLVDGCPEGGPSGVLAPSDSVDGLSEVILGQLKATAAVRSTAGGFDFLGIGRQPIEAADRLLSDAMRETLAQLRSRYDAVLVTAPPVSTADGQALVSLADCVVLEVPLRRTARRQLQSALQELTGGRSTLLGTVLVGPTRAAGVRGLIGRLLPRPLRPERTTAAQPAAGSESHDPVTGTGGPSDTRHASFPQ